MQQIDTSYSFTNISPDVAARINLGLNTRENQGTYIFPTGSLIPTVFSGSNSFSSLSLSNGSNIIPLSLNSSTFTSGSIMTSSGTSIYTLSGKNSYGDPLTFGSATIIGTQSPTFTAFSGNILGNTPNAPLQISYAVKNATNIAVTSSTRAISVPPDTLSGSLIINNPQEGEIFTLSATNIITNTTEQIQLTYNSTAIFSCIPPNRNEIHTGARTTFYGCGELTLAASPDDQRLYIGRALSIPSLIYLGTNLIGISELSNMPLSTFNFYSDGTPNILSCDSEKLYVCQPSGGKVTIYDSSTQTAIEEFIGTHPTNIEINNDYVVLKDGDTLKILDKSYTVLSQFPLEGLTVEANDKEIFITTSYIYILDGSKIKIVNLNNLLVIEKIIDLSADYHILSGSLVVSETLNKIFLIGSDLTGIPSTTSSITGITINVNLWVYDLTADILETVNLIQSTDKPEIRYGMRLDIDESRLFIVADQLNKVACFSTALSTSYAQLESWDTTKPFGLGLSSTGKFLYYSGQDVNTPITNTQTSRHLVIMRLRESTLSVSII